MERAAMDSIGNRGTGANGDVVKPAYVPPRIITYTSEELLDQIGPAMACSPSECVSGP